MKKIINQIETERLILRPFTMEDLDIIELLYGNPNIMKYMPCGSLSGEEIEIHMRNIVEEGEKEKPENFEMAVVSKADNTKIGRAHLSMDYEGDSAMIGWLIIESEWGKGYATEISKGLFDFCFKELNLHRVTALCNPNNTGSWKVLEKCGMRKEAHFVQKVKYKRGEEYSWEDEAAYAILKEEYI